jgi:hypothetical protein
MVYSAINCDFPPELEDIFSSYQKHHDDTPLDEDNEYSNIERDFEEIWDDLFKADIWDEDEIARPLVEDGDSQDELESLTTKSGTNLFNIINPITNYLASFPKQVAKQMDNEVDYITLPNEAHKAPVINPFLVELKKEFKDELVDTTMIKEDDFNPMKNIEELELLLAKDPFSSFMEDKGRLTTNGTNEEERRLIDPQHTTLSHVMFMSTNLTTKPGKVRKEVQILPRYSIYIFLPSLLVANLRPYGAYCYYHPHLIASGGTYTLLPSK